MTAQQSYKSALLTAGFLMLFYLAYALAQPPPRAKARGQRISSVNAAPRLSMSFTLSNAPAPATEPPSTGK